MAEPDVSGERQREDGWRVEPWVASDLLRQHRELFAAYTSAPPGTVDFERQLPADVAAGLAAAGRPVPPLDPEAIPAALRELVQEHEARTGICVEPLRLVVTGTGENVIVAGDQGLPAEGELVSFSVTRAVVTSDGVDVAHLVLLAARCR